MPTKPKLHACQRCVELTAENSRLREQLAADDERFADTANKLTNTEMDLAEARGLAATRLSELQEVARARDDFEQRYLTLLETNKQGA